MMNSGDLCLQESPPPAPTSARKRAAERSEGLATGIRRRKEAAAARTESPKLPSSEEPEEAKEEQAQQPQQQQPAAKLGRGQRAGRWARARRLARSRCACAIHYTCTHYGSGFPIVFILSWTIFFCLLSHFFLPS